MDKNLVKSYYSRVEIQKALLNIAKKREIGTRFDGYFGKRPDILENLFDIKKLVNNNVQSFHMSEERWTNPLILANQKLSQDDKAKNRIGWDLILDLDGVDYLFAQMAGDIIVDFLDEIGVKNVTTKFSGNKGFHIGIPFEAFPQEIIGIGETRKLFPEAPRKIVTYLIEELKSKISKTILEKFGTIENVAKEYNLELEDLIIDDKESYNFDFLKVIEIDTILIASRHLVRMPYSLHEKSGLVSIPIKNKDMKTFDKRKAQPALVDPKKYEDFEFLRYDSKYGKDAGILLVKAYENFDDLKAQEYEERAKQSDKFARQKNKGMIFEGDNSGDFFDIEVEIEQQDFPKTIQYVLDNKLEDGKKRAIFLLMTFLYSIKYSPQVIEEMIKEWNEKQPDPLKDNYLVAQFNWFKARESLISPPNFDNLNYYKGIGVPKELIEEDRKKFNNVTLKNPLHYVFILSQRKKFEQDKKAEQKSKKKQTKKEEKKD